MDRRYGLDVAITFSVYSFVLYTIVRKSSSVRNCFKKPNGRAELVGNSNNSGSLGVLSHTNLESAFFLGAPLFLLLRFCVRVSLSFKSLLLLCVSLENVSLLILSVSLVPHLPHIIASTILSVSLVPRADL